MYSVSDKTEEDAVSLVVSESEKSRPSTAAEDSMKVGVHHGQYDEMIAWANISLEDLESLVCKLEARN